MNESAPRRAFTIVELIAAVVIVLLLAGICFPRFHDYTAQAKEENCRAALEGMRAGISHFHMNASSKGEARWPTIKELQSVGVVLSERIPPNPYLANGNISSLVVAGTWPERGLPPVERSPTGGWVYDEESGRIWANSATIPAGAPGGPENTW